MKKIFILFVFVVLSFCLIAQPSATYYNTASGLVGTPLRSALKLIIDGHSVKSYSSLYTHFATMDTIKINGTIRVHDIYSLEADTPSASNYFYSYGSGTCGSYTVEGDCYNREHSWPQSWFNSVSGPQSDLFHLYPTDGKVNGIRSSYPFAEVATVTTTTTNGSLLGSCASAGYTGTVFEPRDEFKGDLARGYFYMSTRYYGEDASWASSGNATNKCEILPWQLDVLMQWHTQDPVSPREEFRNNRIFAIQGNRNPFIDNPSYAQDIWPSTITGAKKPRATDVAFAVYPNPANNNITLDNLENSSTIIITNTLGNIVLQHFNVNANSTILDIANLSNGLYTITAIGEKSTRKRTFLILNN